MIPFTEKGDIKSSILEIREGRIYSFLNLILLIAILIIIIVNCITVKNQLTNIFNSNVNATAANCTTCNSCQTSTPVLDSCQTGIKQNNLPCGDDDQCFNHTLCNATCQSGVCEGPRACCRGFCEIDSDCPDIPVLTQGISKMCGVNNTCLYTMTDTQTNDCLILIDGPKLRNCLHGTYTPDFFLVGTCLYYFKCAPPNVGTSIPFLLSPFQLQSIKTMCNQTS